MIAMRSSANCFLSFLASLAIGGPNRAGDAFGAVFEPSRSG
jgi:hypothetical protein